MKPNYNEFNNINYNNYDSDIAFNFIENILQQRIKLYEKKSNNRMVLKKSNKLLNKLIQIQNEAKTLTNKPKLFNNSTKNIKKNIQEFIFKNIDFCHSGKMNKRLLWSLFEEKYNCIIEFEYFNNIIKSLFEFANNIPDDKIFWHGIVIKQ